jgi:hypothetical protein
MGTHPFIRNIIVAGIFFLLIISTVVSNINVAGITSKDNLVTMTTKACSLTTDTTHTIQLSKQQAQKVQLIFDNLKNRLSTAESAEETQIIFNETIIELDRYNLLPEEMSVEQAQRLVSYRQRTTPLLQRLPQNIQTQTNEGTIQNSFCSIAGNTSNTHFAKLAKRTALRLYYIIDFNTGNAPLNKMATALFVVFNEIAKINQKILRQNGSHLGVCIYFGNYHYAPYPDWLSPAQGWISTNGVNGKQNITGSFWGQTMTGGWQPQVDWYMNYTWRGCLGFTGLIYYTGEDNAYFLGSALSVNVGPNRP